MSKIKTAVGTAPAHWAPYLINGDASGISEDDAKQADAFEEWLTGEHGYISGCSLESLFKTYHDARKFGALAADCLTYTAIIPQKELSHRDALDALQRIKETMFPNGDTGAEWGADTLASIAGILSDSGLTPED